MENKIIKQEKNPFLNREELTIEISTDTTPKFDDVKQIVGKDENVVVVKKVEGNFGQHKFTAEVFVYDSPEARKKFEVIPKKVKKKMAEEEKAKKEAEKKAAAEAAKKAEEEAKAAEEAAKAEQPAETPVEEAKTEEKTE